MADKGSEGTKSVTLNELQAADRATGIRIAAEAAGKKKALKDIEKIIKGSA